MGKVIVQKLQFPELPAELELPNDDPRRWMITTDEFPVPNTGGRSRRDAIYRMCLNIMVYIENEREQDANQQ